MSMADEMVGLMKRCHFLRPSDLGIEGNTNLILLERDNLEGCGVISDWLNRRVRA
jgi:hypothetical protein